MTHSDVSGKLVTKVTNVTKLLLLKPQCFPKPNQDIFFPKPNQIVERTTVAQSAFSLVRCTCHVVLGVAGNQTI